MAAEMVAGGSRERTAVPRVCTQQRRPSLQIEGKLFCSPHPDMLLICCQNGKGSPCPFPRGQKINQKGVKGQRPKELNIHLAREK